MYLVQLKSGTWTKACKSGVLEDHIYELHLNLSDNFP